MCVCRWLFLTKQQAGLPERSALLGGRGNPLFLMRLHVALFPVLVPVGFAWICASLPGGSHDPSRMCWSHFQANRRIENGEGEKLGTLLYSGFCAEVSGILALGPVFSRKLVELSLSPERSARHFVWEGSDDLYLFPLP